MMRMRLSWGREDTYMFTTTATIQFSISNWNEVAEWDSKTAGHQLFVSAHWMIKNSALKPNYVNC